jgi:hypothetical protein
MQVFLINEKRDTGTDEGINFDLPLISNVELFSKLVRVASNTDSKELVVRRRSSF